MAFGNNKKVKGIAYRDIRNLTLGSLACRRFW